MKSILSISLASVLFLGSQVPVLAQNVTPRQQTNPKSITDKAIVKPGAFASKVAVPMKQTIPISQLSKKARAAAETIKSWTNNPSTQFISMIIYREGDENYMFYQRGTQFFIFETNPEIGGSQTMPYNKVFTVNMSTLLGVLSKENSDGQFYFTDGEYFENWVTPLVAIDSFGNIIPGQNIHKNKALHSIPYSDPKGPNPDPKHTSNSLKQRGHGCGRFEISVAKFIQKTVIEGMITFPQLRTQVRVARWDPNTFKPLTVQK
jgi:hypothetical protein